MCIILWTRILVKKFLMLDLFQLLSSPDVNRWTGVVWIIVMFYQLFGLSSDGTCLCRFEFTCMKHHRSPRNEAFRTQT